MECGINWRKSKQFYKKTLLQEIKENVWSANLGQILVRHAINILTTTGISFKDLCTE